MPILSILYNLIIGPLELLFEFVFAIVNKIINNPGLSIIFLSLAMNFLVLPLYKRADAMQAEQRDTEQRLKPWVDHIKKTFKGDERFMMLQTFYRQNNYKPTDALKGMVSLLLEIPFFIAAYRMISGLELLNGESFGLIKDLGAPDHLLVIGAVAINILPILMTLINIVSGAIYTKGMSAQSKIQLYGMAVIFLVLLYNSPSGLVFYWTLNNVFSLVKNIFYKLKNPKLVLRVLFSLSGILVALVGLIISPVYTIKKKVFVILLALALQLPIIFGIISKHIKINKNAIIRKGDKLLFLICGIYLSVLTGLLIPSTVINTSSEEFINNVLLNNPLEYLFSSFSLSFGAFVIWASIFYTLVNDNFKKLMGYLMWILAGISTADYMFFGRNYGNLNSNLRFDVFPTVNKKEALINIAVVLILLCVFALVLKIKPGFCRAICLTSCAVIIGMSGFQIIQAQQVIKPKLVEMTNLSEQKPNFNLDKNGQNVIVLMMDRAINCYIPYMFNEKPELVKQFEGFTYYPNTLSFGAFTNTGSPALYGGYEYMPNIINERENELLVDKQNEALKVMPVLFDNNGFEVTVCDPTYAGYDWIPDLTIYDDYPDINTFITKGVFDENRYENAQNIKSALERNFFCYSLFKISPIILQNNIYQNSTYFDPDVIFRSNENNINKGYGSKTNQVTKDLHISNGLSNSFVEPYAVLEALPKITNISDDGRKTFLMMSNDTTHDPMLLQEPDYCPSMSVDNTEFDMLNKDRFTINGRTLKMENEQQIKHYQSNMASMIKIGKWLDYMRENDVYDNTRIIIVADHGRNLAHFDDWMFGDKNKDEDVMFYNPLLMVKDFNSDEFTTDNQFMTNGDVPTIASKDIIINPVNPMTNVPINNNAKKDDSHYVLLAPFSVRENYDTQFKATQWYEFEGNNIFDISKWNKVASNN